MKKIPDWNVKCWTDRFLCIKSKLKYGLPSTAPEEIEILVFSLLFSFHVS